MIDTICPVCGAELDGIIYTTNPPIHVWRCPKCGYQIDKGTIGIGKIEPKKTNADRIRSMTDEELAHLLHSAEEHLFNGNLWDYAKWLDWLRQEAR